VAGVRYGQTARDRAATINTISTCPFGQVIRNSMRVVILGERLEMNRIGRNPYNIYSFT